MEFAQALIPTDAKPPAVASASGQSAGRPLEGSASAERDIGEKGTTAHDAIRGISTGMGNARNVGRHRQISHQKYITCPQINSQSVVPRTLK